MTCAWTGTLLCEGIVLTEEMIFELKSLWMLTQMREDQSCLIIVETDAVES